MINHNIIIMHSVGRDLKELFTTKQVQRFFNGTPACMAEDKGIYQHGAMRMVRLPLLIQFKYAYIIYRSVTATCSKENPRCSKIFLSIGMDMETLTLDR